MKAYLPLFVLAALLLGLTPSTLLSQCAGTCPSNDNDCINDANCCIVDSPGNSIPDCLMTGATLLRVRVNSTLNTGDISGTQFCLDNHSLVIGENVTVDNSTCFEANGSFGVSVTIGGTTFTFNANDGGLDDLNTALGNLASGSTIGAVAQSLPVSLKSFAAEGKDQQTVLIEWVTSMESDNDYFLLEHSTDGEQFSTLQKMNSYGNSLEEQYYQYRHSSPNAGLNYYRLWQYDLDGTHANLGLVEVKLEGNGQVRLYPNPVRSGESIQLLGVDLAENPECTLHNWVGQSWPLIAGPNGLSIPADFPAGMYFIKIATAAETAPIPVQIQ